MTVYDYLESLDMDWTAKSRLYGIITGRQDNQNITFANYMAKSKKMEMPSDFQIPKAELLDLLTTVNKMVKHESCPNNLKNRFYTQKKSIIRKMIKDHRVSDIYDQGDYYSLVVDYYYKFHQPKSFLNHLDFEVVGSQPYTSGETPIPFNPDTYREFEILYYIFTGQFRYARQGFTKDPKHYSGKKYRQEHQA